MKAIERMGEGNHKGEKLLTALLVLFFSWHVCVHLVYPVPFWPYHTNQRLTGFHLQMLKQSMKEEKLKH